MTEGEVGRNLGKFGDVGKRNQFTSSKLESEEGVWPLGRTELALEEVGI